jgi:hypothetical protein
MSAHDHATHDDDSHECPVDRCTRRVPYVVLMCRRHWAKVPRQLQRNVYRTWRRGAGAGTPEHARAMSVAIDAVHDELEREALANPR